MRFAGARGFLAAQVTLAASSSSPHHPYQRFLWQQHFANFHRRHACSDKEPQQRGSIRGKPRAASVGGLWRIVLRSAGTLNITNKHFEASGRGKLSHPVPKTCTSVRQRVAIDMTLFALDAGEQNGYTSDAPQGVESARRSLKNSNWQLAVGNQPARVGFAILDRSTPGCAAPLRLRSGLGLRQETMTV
jgi:hypothetical protein